MGLGVLSISSSSFITLSSSSSPRVDTHNHNYKNNNNNYCSLSFLSSFPTTLTLTASPTTTTTSLSTWGGGGGGGSLIKAAAWTRRSRGEAAKKPNRKSWKQRSDMYLRPFLLDVFFSKRFVHAKVVHRGTSKVISVATTNSKDLRHSLPSLTDHDACRVVGRLIAQRSKDADVYALAYEPRKDERIQGKLGILLDTIKENGIIFV